MEKVYHDNLDGSLNVSCTYDAKEYGPIINKVTDNLCNKVTVQGFRKGKAPREMALRYIKNEDIYQGMIDKLIDKDFANLLDGFDSSLVANIRPALSIDFNDKKKTYNLLYTFYLLPKCELKKTTGLGIKVTLKKVTEKDIDAKIDSLLVDGAELVPSKDAAENGDHTTLDFKGYVDGKEFDGGSANDYELVLGSNSFVPGFEEQVVGMKEGDKKTIEVTFPANYLASLANKVAKFAISCKGVKKVVKPELNDEFASTLQNYKVKTVEELKAAIKAELAEANKTAQKNEKVSKIMEALAKDTKVVVSNNYLELAANQVQENQLGQFKQYGLDLDQYLKISGLTLDQFKANCKAQAQNEATTFAINKAVATANKLVVSDDEVAEQFGGKEKFDELMKTAQAQKSKNPNFNVEGYISSIKEQILQNKVRDFLIENN